MDRQVLIKGFLKIFVPLAVAGTVGTLIGVVLGLGAYHTFFYIVIPIMAAASARGPSRCRSAIPRSFIRSRGCCSPRCCRRSCLAVSRPSSFPGC